MLAERTERKTQMCGRIGFDAAMGDKRIIPTGEMAWVQAFPKWFQGI